MQIPSCKKLLLTIVILMVAQSFCMAPSIVLAEEKTPTIMVNITANQIF